MASRRDVQLVIRAKNEATKAVDAVTSALREINQAAQDFKSGASGTDSLLSSLGTELAKLDQGGRGSNAFQRLAKGSREAEQAVSRLQGELRDTADAHSQLTAEVQKAEQAAGRMAQEVDKAAAELDRQKTATQEARAEQSRLNQEIRKSEFAQKRKAAADAKGATRIEVLNQKVLEAQQRYGRLGAEIEAAANPTKRLQQSYEAAGRALERNQATLERARQAQARNRQELEATGDRLGDLRQQLKSASAAYDEQQAAQQKASNNLAEVKAQARGAQQQYMGLKKAVDDNERAFDQQGHALQRANEELREVQQVTAGADRTLSKMATTVRTQLLRAFRDAQTQLESYQRAAKQGTANVAGLARQGVSPESTQFRQAVQEARLAKQAYREQQIAVELMRRELRAAGTDAQALANAQQRFQAIQAGVNSRVREASTVLEREGRAVGGVRRRTDEAARSNQRFGNTFALLRQNTRQSLSLFQRLRGELLTVAAGFVGITAAITGTRGVAHAYMSLEAAQNRLGSIFGQNQERVSQEIDWLMAQADRLGIAFDTLSDTYAKFSVAANVANFQSEATRKVFMSVAEAGRVNKLSMDQMRGIFMALEQMISKGKITSEELRRQLGDRLPGAFQIMAEALDMTTAELDDAMKAGEVFADQDSLLKFADQLDERFGKQLPEALQSFTTLWGRLQNEFFKAQLRTGKGGFIEGLEDAMASLIDYFQSADGVRFFNNLGAAAGGAAKVLAALVRNLDVVLAVMAAIVGKKLGVYVTALAQDFQALGKTSKIAAAEQRVLNAAQQRSVVQSRTMAGVWAMLRTQAVGFAAGMRGAAAGTVAFARGLTVARAAAVATVGVMRTLRAVVATLGGPIGLLVTAVSILFTEWAFSASEAQVATAELARQMRILRDAAGQAGDDMEVLQEKLEKLTITQVEENLRKLREQFEDGLSELSDQLPSLARGEGFVGDIRVDFKDLRPLQQAISKLRRDFEQGLNPDIDTFRTKVDEIARSNPDVKEIAVSLLEVLDRAESGEQSLTDLSGAYQRQADILTLKLKPGTDEAREAMERLGIAGKETIKPTAESVDKLAEAAKKLNEHLPEMKIELERLKEVGELQGILGGLEVNPETWSTDQLAKYYDLVQKIYRTIDRVNEEAAKKHVTGGLVDRISLAESGGDAGARNPLSTATGLGQFIESTWLQLFREHFPDRAKGMTDAAVLALREDADTSRQMIQAYAKENSIFLQKAIGHVDDAALYLSHFLGPNGALKVLQAGADTPVADILSPAAVNANPGVLGAGQTAGGLREWAAGKVGMSDEDLALAQEMNELWEERVQTQEDFNNKLQQESSDRAFQLQQLKLEAAGKERQAAVNEAIRKAELEAQEEGLQLSKQQRDTIVQQTGALFDQKQLMEQAGKRQEMLQGRVNSLMEHRRNLIEMIRLAEEQGDQATADRLLNQFNNIDLKLRGAIQAAREFWQTQSGEEAQAALANLNLMEQNLAQIGQKAQLSGRQINEMFAGGAADAFMQFADAVANGQNAIQSLGDAFRQFAADFLRQLARMIIQQAIFNAISGMAGGGGVGGAIANFFNVGTNHTGGLAGTGPSRSVASGWFSNAARYHNGGIAGVKPGEVPAILERGEEVLTKDDPRHVANGGAAAPQMPEVKVINAIDPGDFVSKGMNTASGQQAIFNFMRANKQKLKGVLS